MAVSLKLGEVVIDAIVSKLQAGYAARVAAINADDTKGITIAAPADADYYIGGATQMAQAPAIIVTEFPSGDYEAEGPHSFVFVGEYGVAVLEEDADRSILARKLLRQARAIQEAIWDDAPAEQLSGSAFTITPVRLIPGRVFEPTDENANWRQLYIVVFRARQLEG